MTTYTAHIVTDQADGYGEPAVTVTTQADDTGAADPVAEYPLNGDPELPLLRDHGWRMVGEPEEVATGYTVVDVEPVDPVALVAAVTHSRAQAQAEMDRQDVAWRTVIRDAMHDEHTVKTRVAAAAGISRDWAYRIRDGRR